MSQISEENLFWQLHFANQTLCFAKKNTRLCLNEYNGKTMVQTSIILFTALLKTIKGASYHDKN